jgi:hypothetical protein
MAYLFDSYKDNLLGDATFPDIDLDTDVIQICMNDADITALDAAADQDHADFTPYGDAMDQAFDGGTLLANVDIATTSGVFDNTADLTLTAMAAGPATLNDVVIYKSLTSSAASPVICAWIAADITELPVTLNGGDIVISPNASGLFSI